jgi:hypothetical protein
VFVRKEESSILSVGYLLYAAPAPALGKNLDAAPAAPAPTLLNSKAKFLKRSKFKHMLKLFCSFDSLRFILLKI